MTTIGEVSSEGVVLAGAGRALLLQLAHPAVGRGVIEHSRFADDPLARLHGTLTYIYAVVAGDETDAATARRYVDAAHRPVHGDGYDARDPVTQLWVAATLYDTAIELYERVYGPLDDRDAERVYAAYAVLGTALQMPAGLWPSDRAAFREYFDGMVERLEVDREVRAVARRLFDARTLPRVLRPAVPWVAFATAALLPARVRTLYGIRWTGANELKARRLGRLGARAYRSLPDGIRHWPRDHYLGRLRRFSRERPGADPHPSHR
jgi:uncharacterized protein (DUF2236 family)